eukprot:Hpha_TRINITY_DN16103_c1_g1::TRINITY_DN16103_c1_g1_i2::g.7535::m.7535
MCVVMNTEGSLEKQKTVVEGLGGGVYRVAHASERHTERRMAKMAPHALAAELGTSTGGDGVRTSPPRSSTDPATVPPSSALTVACPSNSTVSSVPLCTAAFTAVATAAGSSSVDVTSYAPTCWQVCVKESHAASAPARRAVAASATAVQMSGFDLSSSVTSVCVAGIWQRCVTATSLTSPPRRSFRSVSSFCASSFATCLHLALFAHASFTDLPSLILRRAFILRKRVVGMGVGGGGGRGWPAEHASRRQRRKPFSEVQALSFATVECCCHKQTWQSLPSVALWVAKHTSPDAPPAHLEIMLPRISLSCSWHCFGAFATHFCSLGVAGMLSSFSIALRVHRWHLAEILFGESSTLT